MNVHLHSVSRSIQHTGGGWGAALGKELVGAWTRHCGKDIYTLAGGEKQEIITCGLGCAGIGAEVLAEALSSLGRLACSGLPADAHDVKPLGHEL